MEFDEGPTQQNIWEKVPRLQLLVVTAGGFTKHLLPVMGEVIVGRAVTASVMIPSDSISRRHLRIQIGQEITVEDLGSANGSRYRDNPLVPGQPQRINVGDAIELPNVTLFLQQQTEPREAGAQAASANGGGPEGSVIIRDPGMQRLYALVDDIAPSPISVLVLGETGVGKEVLAEEIHRRSPRANKQLVRLNCAALPEQLLESELFGHEKGSFTGAVQAKPGLIEVADGGTVFLDEVGELPATIQAKLLRVIEMQRVLRVGGLKEKQVDVRFVSATNRDLEAEVARGGFRADLLYRLNGVTLEVPPLRQRRGEIEPLCRLFLGRACERLGRAELPEISPAARDVLVAHDWPGNIRELRNVLERAVLLCKQGRIEPEHLPMEKMTAAAPKVSPVLEAPPPAVLSSSTFEEPRPTQVLSSLKVDPDEEKRRIMVALEQSAGNQSRAAKLLGISRRTLINRIEAYGLPRPRKDREEHEPPEE